MALTLRPPQQVLAVVDRLHSQYYNQNFII